MEDSEVVSISDASDHPFNPPLPIQHTLRHIIRRPNPLPIPPVTQDRAGCQNSRGGGREDGDSCSSGCDGLDGACDRRWEVGKDEAATTAGGWG